MRYYFFFFNDTATTEIYTLSLHDALPISRFLYCPVLVAAAPPLFILTNSCCGSAPAFYSAHFSLRQRPRFFLPNSHCGSVPAFHTAHFSLRSEEHTSELQSPVPISYAVFCLKKKKNTKTSSRHKHTN